MKTAAKIILLLNVVILVLHWGFTICFFTDLPEIIPSHFGFDGVADGFSNKKSIWLLPIISTGIFILMKYMSKNPYAPGLNIPDSMRRNKGLTEMFVLTMSFFSVLLFAGIDCSVILGSMGNNEDIGFFPLFILGLMFVVMFLFFWIAHQLDKKNNKEIEN